MLGCFMIHPWKDGWIMQVSFVVSMLSIVATWNGCVDGQAATTLHTGPGYFSGAQVENCKHVPLALPRPMAASLCSAPLDIERENTWRGQYIDDPRREWAKHQVVVRVYYGPKRYTGQIRAGLSFCGPPTSNSSGKLVPCYMWVPIDK